MRVLPVLLVLCCTRVLANPLEVSQSPNGDMLVHLNLQAERGRQIVATEIDGKKFHVLKFPALPASSAANGWDLPFVAYLVAVPPNASVEIEILEMQIAKFDNIILPPSDLADVSGPAPALFDHSSGTSTPATANYLGVLGGIDTHSLQLRPISYDANHLRLSVCTNLLIAIRFVGSGWPERSAKGSLPAPLHGGFLNPLSPPSRVAAKRAQLNSDGEWYDPSVPWVKMTVENDGVFRTNPSWFVERNINTTTIDPRTFRLFHLGREQPLWVAGEDDGFFDGEDYLLFVGRYRRDLVGTASNDLAPAKDFDSIYGRTNVYWLTWGNSTGKRYEIRDAAPIADFPQTKWYWTTAHFEQDLEFQSFPDAPDNKRDHWYRKPIRGVNVDTPGSAVIVGKLSAPYFEEEYDARLRVAMHGQTPAHHTVLKLNNKAVGEYFWEGQDEFFVEEDIPSDHLRDGTNRLLVQAFASATKGRDHSLFNYFAIDYRRHHDAWPGFLQFGHEASAGKRVIITGFSHPQIYLFDTERALSLTGVLVDSTSMEESTVSYNASFEDASDVAVKYVVVDSTSIREPDGFLDSTSHLRELGNGADYLIVAHRDFLAAAKRLADHRRQDGLTVNIVFVDDIYDEFAHGLMMRESIRDFLEYAYHNWSTRPTYVLLLGDATFDYRNIFGGGEPSYVPTLYYQARSRGHSPSDYLYSLIDGNDLLPDVAIGRLAVESADEAKAAVDKIIAYDLQPESGDWRSRVIYLANYHAKQEFTRPSDELANHFSEPYGLKSVKIYNPDEQHLPNPTGRAFIDALNAGALLVNFNGHGAAGTLQFVFSLQFPDWDYLSLVDNGHRLPLVTALSCLNGMFVNPHTESIGEVLTDRAEGGSIAYISATAQSFTSQNDLLSQHLYGQFFSGETLAFGPALNTAKARVLATHSSWTASVLTMQLFGDPAQKLALPQHADYQPLALTITGERVRGSTVGVNVELVNNTRATGDSISVTVFAEGDAGVDTLYKQRTAPFVGKRSLTFDWLLGERTGVHVLAVHVDDDQLVEEADESNNKMSTTVDILSPLIPTLVFPADDGVVLLDSLVFEAVLEGTSDDRLQFQLSTRSDFGEGHTTLSPISKLQSGLGAFRPDTLPLAKWFWRARVVDGATIGPWSRTRSVLVADSGSQPDANIQRWRQDAPLIAAGDIRFLELDGEGLKVARTSTALPPTSTTREDGYTVRDLKGAGVLVTDGTYLYAKRWFNDFSTVYPGNDFFTRVGTGLNGSIRGHNYGVVGDSTTAGMSATYHSDGYIYSENGQTYELERLSLNSGRLDTVAVPDGLLEWKYGRVEHGHSLITSDGALIYNVSMSSASGTRTGWGVRVFDPNDGWRLVREFTSAPTENGFTYEWTDGILADGERLYFIEFGGQRRIRMVDAVNGRFIGEWTTDQDTTRIISGQYDWINNKMWLGDLFGSAVFRYSGKGIPLSGWAFSKTIGPTERWSNLEIASKGIVAVDVMIVDKHGDWTPLAGFSGLAASEKIDLSGMDATIYPRIRLRAQVGDSTHSVPSGATLISWQVDSVPASDLKLTSATAVEEGTALTVVATVRNLSPFAVEGAQAELLAGDATFAFAKTALPLLARGKMSEILFELSPPPVDGPLFVRVTVPGQPDANPLDNLLGIRLAEEAIRATARRWPSGEQLQNGDPLRPGEAITIHVPFVESGHIGLSVGGTPQQPDSIFAASSDSGMQVLYRPTLAPGPHRLTLRVFNGVEEVGSSVINFVVTDALTLANVTIYPHPLRERGTFTYVLSHDASVSVDVFSLSGRRVISIDPVQQRAGFAQIPWDGRDTRGNAAASGTYLYVIEATAAGQTALKRGPLVIIR